jgi:hypothetical protein
MAYSNLRNFVALACLGLFLLGCESAPDPQKVGVFASTNHGLVELTVYGEQDGMTSYDLSKLQDAPTVGKVEQFYVNMPDSKITNSKMFWLATPDKKFNEEGKASLNASIEIGKNGVYRIKCADLEGKKAGYILLKISMPLGTADRMYVIRLSE